MLVVLGVVWSGPVPGEGRPGRWERWERWERAERPGRRAATEAQALRAMQRLCSRIAAQKLLVIASLEDDCSKEDLHAQIAVLQELQKKYVRLEMALQYSFLGPRRASVAPILEASSLSPSTGTSDMNDNNADTTTENGHIEDPLLNRFVGRTHSNRGHKCEPKSGTERDGPGPARPARGGPVHPTRTMVLFPGTRDTLAPCGAPRQIGLNHGPTPHWFVCAPAEGRTSGARAARRASTRAPDPQSDNGSRPRAAGGAERDEPWRPLRPAARQHLALPVPPHHAPTPPTGSLYLRCCRRSASATSPGARCGPPRASTSRCRYHPTTPHTPHWFPVPTLLPAERERDEPWRPLRPAARQHLALPVPPHHAPHPPLVPCTYAAAGGARARRALAPAAARRAPAPRAAGTTPPPPTPPTGSLYLRCCRRSASATSPGARCGPPRASTSRCRYHPTTPHTPHWFPVLRCCRRSASATSPGARCGPPRASTSRCPVPPHHAPTPPTGSLYLRCCRRSASATSPGARCGPPRASTSRCRYHPTTRPHPPLVPVLRCCRRSASATSPGARCGPPRASTSRCRYHPTTPHTPHWFPVLRCCRRSASATSPGARCGPPRASTSRCRYHPTTRPHPPLVPCTYAAAGGARARRALAPAAARRAPAPRAAGTTPPRPTPPTGSLYLRCCRRSASATSPGARCGPPRASTSRCRYHPTTRPHPPLVPVPTLLPAERERDEPWRPLRPAARQHLALPVPPHHAPTPPTGSLYYAAAGGARARRALAPAAARRAPAPRAAGTTPPRAHTPHWFPVPTLLPAERERDEPWRPLRPAARQHLALPVPPHHAPTPPTGSLYYAAAGGARARRALAPAAARRAPAPRAAGTTPPRAHTPHWFPVPTLLPAERERDEPWRPLRPAARQHLALPVPPPPRAPHPPLVPCTYAAAGGARARRALAPAAARPRQHLALPVPPHHAPTPPTGSLYLRCCRRSASATSPGARCGPPRASTSRCRYHPTTRPHPPLVHCTYAAAGGARARRALAPAAARRAPAPRAAGTTPPRAHTPHWFPVPTLLPAERERDEPWRPLRPAARQHLALPVPPHHAPTPPTGSLYLRCCRRSASATSPGARCGPPRASTSRCRYHPTTRPHPPLVPCTYAAAGGARARRALAPAAARRAPAPRAAGTTPPRAPHPPLVHCTYAAAGGARARRALAPAAARRAPAPRAAGTTPPRAHTPHWFPVPTLLPAERERDEPWRPLRPAARQHLALPVPPHHAPTPPTGSLYLRCCRRSASATSPGARCGPPRASTSRCRYHPTTPHTPHWFTVPTLLPARSQISIELSNLSTHRECLRNLALLKYEFISY
ncbi:hypothetical protein ACJJTC_001118, partial [Scirpophaga incertulas]